LRASPTAHARRLESEAIESRPEIAAARHRILAEQARAHGAEHESYPNVTLSTSYSSMWDMPEHRWMVGVGFGLPIDFQRRSGAVDEAKAMQAQFQSEVAKMTDMAKSEVFVAARKLRESEHVLGMFEQRMLPLARDQIEAARAGFVTAQSPFMAVVEAEKNLRGVELDYHTLRAEADRRRAELDRALGRIPGLDHEEQKP
jgi:outer membrane protein TolC